ncbi:MAG: hypothetical protein AAF318_14455 [Pseudomonadota bacterium]
MSETADAEAEIVEAFYDSVYDPSGWARAVALLASAHPQLHPLIQAETWHHESAPVLAYSNLDPALISRYLANPSINAWRPHHEAMRVGQIVHTLDLLSPGDFRRTAFYNEIMRPSQDIAAAAGTLLHRSKDGFAALAVHFEGVVEEAAVGAAMALLGRVAPHARRAFALSRQTAIRSLSHTAAIIDGLAVPCFALRADGGVLRANQAATAMVERADVITVAGGGTIAPAVPAAQARLAAAIERSATRGEVTVASLPGRDGSFWIAHAVRHRPQTDAHPLVARFVDGDATAALVYISRSDFGPPR